MEIYADESTERVYVRHDRGPYTVLDRDGSIGESHVPRGADLVYDSDGLQPDRSSDDYSAGYDDGFSAAQQEAQARSPRVVTETATGGRL